MSEKGNTRDLEVLDQLEKAGIAYFRMTWSTKNPKTVPSGHRGSVEKERPEFEDASPTLKNFLGHSFTRQSRILHVRERIVESGMEIPHTFGIIYYTDMDGVKKGEIDIRSIKMMNHFAKCVGNDLEIITKFRTYRFAFPTVDKCKKMQKIVDRIVKSTQDTYVTLMELIKRQDVQIQMNLEKGLKECKTAVAELLPEIYESESFNRAFTSCSFTRLPEASTGRTRLYSTMDDAVEISDEKINELRGRE